jgi:putative IMPACT (imprinted ancient) family translation regulator|tara:strand:+ start:688 stop:2097 length:1410 start_codon:yes stop_codon:yes gene_type:complete
MNDTVEQEFQYPPELQNVPTEYNMSHITFEDVNGILSLVEIALERGSIKGQELTVLNQIRNDCLLELQDFQAWQQKRQQIMAIERQLAEQKAIEDRQKEMDGVKATADAKVQSAQETAKILQNRVTELENQIKARNIEPVEPSMKLDPVEFLASQGSTSKAFDNARARNPVPITDTNQPSLTMRNGARSESQVMQDELEPITHSEPSNGEIHRPAPDPMESWDATNDLPASYEGSVPQSETTKTFPHPNPKPEFTVTPPSDDPINQLMEEAWEQITQEDATEDSMLQTDLFDDYEPAPHHSTETPLFTIQMGQDGNVPLGQKVSEEDINMNTTEYDESDDLEAAKRTEDDDFEPIQGDGEVELEVSEDPESIEDVQKMKDAVEDEYDEIVIPNSMELQKMTKGKIAEVAGSLGFEVSESQTKDSMIRDFEEEAWNLIQQAEKDEEATISQDENIIRDGGYFAEDEDKDT